MTRRLILFAALAVAVPSAQARPFKGEDCASCHAKIRDAGPPDVPQPSDAGDFDAVVVGGGISGLSAAHFLKDLNVLVLEKEEAVGGRVRRIEMRGGRSPVAAVYTNAAYGAIKSLLDDLGVKFQPITTQNSLFIASGAYVNDWLTAGVDKLPRSDEVKAKLKKLMAEAKALVATGGMTIPIERSQHGVLTLYDRTPFWQYLEDLYGKEVAEIGDLYSRDVFGIGAKEISAFAGMFYLEGEFETTYSGIGGLGEVSEALAGELGERVRTEAFVWRVTQSTRTARVEFDKGGKSYFATAKAVVWAVPSMVTRRLAVDLSAPKRRALGKVRYSSYAVVPFSVFKPLVTDTFVLWTPKAYFTDLTFPLQEPGADGQLVVAYVPYGGDLGRARLLGTTDATIRARTLKSLDTLFPGSSADVREMQVIRWGHAMPVPYPYYLSKVRPVVERPEGRYFFAGVDTQMPAFEGAVYSGFNAAQKVRRFLGLAELPEPAGAPPPPQADAPPETPAPSVP